MRAARTIAKARSGQYLDGPAIFELACIIDKHTAKDTQRLDALIGMADNGGSTDFAHMLFFARQKRKTEVGAYRLALDQWIRDGRA